jgi:DNA-binding Xre family transcriptional regulator
MKRNDYMAIKFKLKERIADLEFRERRVIQLKDIAEATGIHRVTLSKLANNKRYNVGIDTLDKLCDYFKCGLGEIAEYVAELQDENF